MEVDLSSVQIEQQAAKNSLQNVVDTLERQVRQLKA